MTRFFVVLAVLALAASQLHAERYVYRPKYKSIPPKPKVEDTIKAKAIVPPPPARRVYHAPYDVFGTGSDMTYTEINGVAKQLAATYSTVPARPRPVPPPPPPPEPRPQIPAIVYIQAPAAAPVVQEVDNSDELREIAWEIAHLRRQQEFQAMWHDDDCRYGRGYYPPVFYGYGGGYRPVYLPVPGYPNGF